MSGTVFARGSAKTLAAIAETAYGVQPTGTAQLLRRTGATLNLMVQEIDSQEILASQQMRDSRQGPRQVQGQIEGYLSPASYDLLFENLFRSSFYVGGSVTSITDSVLTVNSTTGAITLSGAAENFLTSGFKIGDVARITGTSGADTGDSNANLQVTGVTANALTFASLPGAVAYATGQTVSISTVGKKCIIPSLITAQTLGSLTFEQWYSDIGVSEVSTGCRITDISLNVPPAGFATFQARVLGQQQTRSLTQAYPSATPESTSTLLTATNGSLLIAGVPVAVVTGFNIQIATQAMAQPVVGSNIVPDVFVGTFDIKGSLTALMIADNLTADYLGEVELQLALLMTTSSLPNADFVQIFLPRVKLMAESKNDNDREITRSFNFVALEQSLLGGTGTAFDDTMIVVQDSMAA
ncbi:phage tail tube protein [Acidiphilium angustum]|uniref:phage tail tube protein n=1 Tax=Acidiphilium angustum TaxID=523 RepID=UPI0004941FE3|nr:phage tail tube protein [Acidiphilium angustum]